jgi:ABC-type transport system substrate-binding protein
MVLRFTSTALASAFLLSSIAWGECEIRIYARFREELRDPIKAISWWDKKYVTLVYDTLIRFDENGDLIPGLALKWKVNPEKNSLHLTLKKGLKFHDGSVVSASDVAGVLKRLKTEKNPDRAKMANLREVKVHSHENLEIIYDKISSYDVYLLATPRFSVYRPENPSIGSGPWIRSAKEGNKTEFKRSMEFPGTCGRLITFDVPFQEAINLFEKGGLDIIEYVSLTPKELASVKSRLNKLATIEPIRTFDTAVLFYSRAGKKYNLERYSLVQNLYQNPDLVINSSDRLASNIIPAGISSVFGLSVPLKKTGNVKIPAIEIFFPDTTEFKGLLVENLKAFFRKYQAPVKISTIPLEKLYELHGKGEVNFHVETITLQAPHPYGILSMFHSKSSENFTGYNDPEFDRLLTLGLSQKDVESYKTFRLASDRLISSGYAIPLVHQTKHVIVSTGVSGYNLSRISTYHEYYSSLKKGAR